MKKKLISPGQINKSLLYIFLIGISSVLNRFIYGYNYIGCFFPMNIYRSIHNAILGGDDECPRHRVFDPFFSYIGVIFISLIFLKEKNISDKNEIEKNIEEKKTLEDLESNKENNNGNFLNLKYDGTSEYLKSTKGFLFYILILFLWIAEENLLLIYVDIFQDLDFWFFELIFVSIIYSRLFSSKILSHQKLGMAINIIVGSLLKIYSIIVTFNSKDDIFYKKHPWLIFFVIFYFLLIILRSYVNTQIKIFFDLKYISQRVLLTSYGIVGFIILGLTGIFTSNVPCSGDLINNVCKFNETNSYTINNITYSNNITYYDNFSIYYESAANMGIRLIVIILGLITFFFEKYYATLTIKLYSPIHVIFSFPIQYFFGKLFLLIFTAIFQIKYLFQEKEKMRKFIADEFGDIFSIIGFLIYLEILELHFCKLDYDLSDNITNRANKEIKELISFIDKNEELESDTN